MEWDGTKIKENGTSLPLWIKKGSLQIKYVQGHCEEDEAQLHWPYIVTSTHANHKPW